MTRLQLPKIFIPKPPLGVPFPVLSGVQPCVLPGSSSTSIFMDFLSYFSLRELRISSSVGSPLGEDV